MEVDKENPRFRGEQYFTLLAALGTNDGINIPQSVFLWGMPSTVKSFVLDKVIADSGIKIVARINSTEITCGQTPFLDTILRQLEQQLAIMKNKRQKMDQEDEEPEDIDEINFERCDNLKTFTDNLENVGEYLNDLKMPSSRVLIVIDHIEKLRRDNGKFLQLFTCLQELLCYNICTVLISCLPWSSYFTILRKKFTTTIYFPQYTKSEIISIISHQPPNENIPIYYSFVEMLVNIFYKQCHDLKKLARLASLNYSTLMNSLPDEEKDIKNKTQLMKLWRGIEPKVKTDFSRLTSSLLPVFGSEPYTSIFSMPLSLKYLLIATYIGSNNAPSTDKRFFVKGRTNERKRKLDDPDKVKTVQLCPESRVIAIFRSIYLNENENVVNTNSVVNSQWLLAQVATLAQIKLISISGDETSGNCKYKCLASYDLVKKISDTVNFELERYLSKFL